MENTDFVIEHIDKEVKVITDRPSSVVNYPANTDFFIENIDDNVISIAHSLNIEASEVEFRPANTDFFIENIDNNVIMIAESLELIPSEVTIRPVNTDFFVENIDKNLIAIAEYYDLEPSRVVLRPANTDMFIENIDRNVTLIKSRTNVITKSGSFINVDVPDGGTMQLTSIDGNATQDGTPTPDAPVPISTVTGENTVKVVGKNLFSGDFSQFDNIGGTGSVYSYFKLPTNGAYTLSLKAKNNVSPQSAQVFLGFSFKGGEAGGGLNWVWTNGSSASAGDIRSVQNENNGVTLEYVSMYVNNAATLQWFTDNFDIQLEYGSQPSAYESYQGQEFPIDLGSIELAKIGTYQDRIYKNEGKWYIEKQTKKVILDGSETGWTIPAGGNQLFRMNNGTFHDGTGLTEDNGALCDNFAYYANKLGNITGNLPNLEFAFTQGAPNINFRYDDLADLASFKTWLGTNKPSVYYALATPTTTEITDETLLEHLNFVADIYEGINNISFIGTGAQGTIEVVINKD